MRKFVLGWTIVLCWVTPLDAQRIESLALATGVHHSTDTRLTAAFAASAGMQLGISWLFVLQRTLADLESADVVGTERDISLALMPLWQPYHGRLFVGVGAALTTRRTQLVDAPDTRRTRVRGVAIGGVRLPIAGNGVAIELSGRGDEGNNITFSALFGVRVRFDAARSVRLGEPASPAVAARAAVWNDVLMQLILLQQNLESFSRIKEIETGIELEFENGSVTLWDDVAKVARVLAAADPPVIITAFGPNAGRVAAAVTAGSFPPERIRMQRADRVYLRAEH